jgi:NUMOD3 motif-containing protein
VSERHQRTFDDIKSELNETLEKAGQTLRILEYRRSKPLALNNGNALDTVHDKWLFIQRLAKNFYVEYFDVLYGSNKNRAESLLKTLVIERAKNGGNAAYQKYGQFHKDELAERAIANKEKARIAGRTPGWIKGHVPWNKGKTKDTNESLRRISEERTGEGNPMYGAEVTAEQRVRQSTLMRNKIESGEFTPNVQNYHTHWYCRYQEIMFRSSWEVAFYQLNPSMKYEKIRIPYTIDGKEHIYIADFFDEPSNTIYEIKPHRYGMLQRVKIDKVKLACARIGYTYITVDENYFIENWNRLNLDEFDLRTRKNLERMYCREISKKNGN